MAFTHSRDTTYIHKATRNTQRNDAPKITHSRPTVASYGRSGISMAAHIWNEQSSTIRNVKSIEAYTKNAPIYIKQNTLGTNGEHSY